jgi:hypothetical protein
MTAARLWLSVPWLPAWIDCWTHAYLSPPHARTKANGIRRQTRPCNQWSQLLRLLRSAAFSAHERLRDSALAHEYFVPGHDKRQLVRLGISLQGLEAPARFLEHRVTKLAVIP